MTVTAGRAIQFECEKCGHFQYESYTLSGGWHIDRAVNEDHIICEKCDHLSQTALTLHEKLEKAEAELAELREECCDIAGNLCNELIKRINNNEPFDAMEMASVVQSRIRKLTGGEDE